MLSACFLFAAAGCSPETDYSSEMNRLNAQIEQLQSELDALKADNLTNFEKLQKELDAATARLTALEAAVQTEPVVCNFGDTYTLSNNGIDLFSIRFNSFEGTNPSTHQYQSLHITITNIHMPECSYSNYLGAYAISDTTTYDYTYKSDTIINQNQSLDVAIMFQKSGSIDFPEPDMLSAIYIGISTGAAPDSVMIPFAILRLNETQN